VAKKRITDHVTLLYHTRALDRERELRDKTVRRIEDRLDTVRERLAAERDRRYTEGAAALAGALKIKEDSNQIALSLAREIQTYKDMVHNGLLGQMKDLIALLATKSEIRPVQDFMQSAQARGRGLDKFVGYLIAGVMAAIAVAAVLYRH